eukprot:COSAG02_NODE_46862_length_345_cov_1.056911_1_plen_75_part_10
MAMLHCFAVECIPTGVPELLETTLAERWLCSAGTCAEQGFSAASAGLASRNMAKGSQANATADLTHSMHEDFLSV